MRKMNWVPQIIFDDDRKRFDAIIDRVKKFQEEHPNSSEFPVSDDDALTVCWMVGLEMDYEFAKQDIKNAKFKEEKKTAEDKYCSLVSFAFEQFGWYLY